MTRGCDFGIAGIVSHVIELSRRGAVYLCKFCQGLSATAKADTDVGTLAGFTPYQASSSTGLSCFNTPISPFI
jgi:hypothetical protein